MQAIANSMASNDPLILFMIALLHRNHQVRTV